MVKISGTRPPTSAFLALWASSKMTPRSSQAKAEFGLESDEVKAWIQVLQTINSV